MSSSILFSTFEVSKQVFFRTTSTAAIQRIDVRTRSPPSSASPRRSLWLIWPSIDSNNAVVNFLDEIGTLGATLADVLVIPTRVVPRFTDLTPNEVSSLFKSVQVVGRTVQRAYKADGLTIACQDGEAAGQSVPHVHVHIIPRKAVGDRYSQNDEVYPELEKHEIHMLNDLNPPENMGAQCTPTTGVEPNSVSQTTPPMEEERGGESSDRRLFAVDNATREPRSAEEMEREAAWLTTLFTPSSTEDIDD